MHFINSSVSLLLLLVGSNVVDAKYAIRGVFTGIDANTGARPARRDIRSLSQDTMQFSLYIQALQAFMDVPEGTRDSYFQISGIHGQPLYEWDGNSRGGPRVGYCTHGSPLFMSWHRPYLALHEQRISEFAQRIAREYNSAAWTNAANQLRIPYLAWDKAPHTVPPVMTTPRVRIRRPNGDEDVWNPLASYRFRNQPYRPTTFSDNPLARTSRTRRRPRCPDCDSQPDEYNAILSAQGPGIVNSIYRVYSQSREYNAMASSGNSLENTHGWLHTTVGGETNGHMTSIDFSAFDPIFWLHHTNVDRQLTLWQYSNPTKDFTPTREPDGAGTFWLNPGQNINAQTPLIPFHGSDGKTAYNTEKVKHPKKFGYSYDDLPRDWEFTGWDGEARLVAAANARINQLYNNRARSAKRARGTNMARDIIPHEWTAVLSAPMDAANGKSFTVYLFLGDRPADTKQWPLKTVGSLTVLEKPVLAGVPAMQGTSQIVLTDRLLDLGIDATNVNATRDYLDTKLSWGVLSGGAVIPNEEFKTFLTMKIEDEQVKLPTLETELPKFTNLTIHEDISAAIVEKR